MLNSHLWQVFMLASSKSKVYPLVQDHLAALVESLQRSATEATHRRLCALAGDLFQLAGEIHFDANQYTDAAHCYSLAASASREAGAYDLWACAVTRHAFIGVYEREYGKAVPMLDLATNLSRRGDSGLSTRHWVDVVRAEALAGLGDFDGCQRALDAAEHVRDLTGQIHNGGWLRFDGSRLHEERGACYTMLRRPDLAEVVLVDALTHNLSAAAARRPRRPGRARRAARRDRQDARTRPSRARARTPHWIGCHRPEAARLAIAPGRCDGQPGTQFEQRHRRAGHGQRNLKEPPCRNLAVLSAKRGSTE